MQPTNKVKSEDLSFKVLTENHDLSAFDCSKDDALGLNEFIHHEAQQYQKEQLGVTYLFFYKGQIVGFATLLMGQIEIKYAPYLIPFKVTTKYFPALLIGRLATDNRYRRRDIGRNICLWCVKKATELSKQVGCRLILVLTEGKPVEFYADKCGFEIFPRFEKKTKKWMYLQIPQKQIP
jgi:GNAT superfamily N-acetyltransferase